MLYYPKTKRLPTSESITFVSDTEILHQTQATDGERSSEPFVQESPILEQMSALLQEPISRQHALLLPQIAYQYRNQNINTKANIIHSHGGQTQSALHYGDQPV